MTDTIELNVGNEFVDEGERTVIQVKESAKKRKGRGFETTVEGWILIVRNIDPEATEEDIKDKFYDYGEILNLHLNVDRRTGFLKGYALIEFEALSEAQEAIKELDGSELHGRKISVSWAFIQGPPNSRKIIVRPKRDRSRSRSTDRQRR